jgi:membrane protein DedA with SNARE-associated domain
LKPLAKERESKDHMIHFLSFNLTSLLTTYGYLAVAIGVAIESTGIPFPGETILITASIYAGTTHHLFIGFVIAAAVAGAIIGDNLGFWIGREGGYRLLRRYGHYVHLNERKIKVGQYLFQQHGGKIVFFGRFVAVLRAWAAFLAGTDRMRWPHFLFFNAAGAIIWATIYGLGVYFLGNAIHRLSAPFDIAIAVIAVIIIVAFFIFMRRNEKKLEDKAVEALPGPLDENQTIKKGKGTGQGKPSADQQDSAKHDSLRTPDNQSDPHEQSSPQNDHLQTPEKMPDRHRHLKV